jgi:hypothetical protein
MIILTHILFPFVKRCVMTGRERGRKGERKSEMRIEAGRDPWLNLITLLGAYLGT